MNAPAPESTLVHLDNYPWQQVERAQRTGGERDLRVAILLLNWAVKRKTKNEGSPPARPHTDAPHMGAAPGHAHASTLNAGTTMLKPGTHHHRPALID
ncbi:hypothetical protein AWZ03_013246 [Drosophila navojoa]|uniref:Uncharacterized protein n=1 Tax=Drosophila navojoa TaxID=7232 RepID=A0A484AWE9_DRONA|nr:hypothetical protein AWZ03_013246 [Drosophila navojoa]